MRVSDSRRVLFVHVQKTGGSTIDTMFDRKIADARSVDNLPRHTSLSGLLEAEPHLADYWSFGFVRNPWERMVSWWAMTVAVLDNADAGVEQARRKVEQYPNVWRPLGQFRHDFDRFVLDGTEKVRRLGEPQCVSLSRQDGSLVDFVGRTEHFDRDFNVVREKLGLKRVRHAGKRNRSQHGHYRDYYNDKTRRRVADVFAPDIEMFGYVY
jgi:hypothetical protein